MRRKGKFVNCNDVLNFAPLYLTGELDPARLELFSMHLEGCPSCARELRRQAECDRLLRAGVLAGRIDSAAVDRGVRREIARESRRWLFTAAGIAAVILAAVLGVRAFSPHNMPVYTAAALDHRLEIVDGQPRKWFTDRAAIDALAGQEGVSDSMISAIAPAGYRLAKGKLCRLDGRVFLHLVYASAVDANASASFSVFLRRPESGSGVNGKRIYTEARGAEHVAGFEGRQLSALIVTEQSGDTALRLARSTAAII